MDRRRTAWKKSRKFGDVKGGRQRAKLTDNLLRRFHSLKRPSSDQECPILIEENPSRDFFFPLSGEELLNELGRLPEEDTEGLTHLWLRRAKKSEYEGKDLPLAWYIAGSGVRAIVLYPWPNSQQLTFGKKRPSRRLLRAYSNYSESLQKEKGQWVLRFSEEGLKRLYVEYLLFHEVGHHVDYRRRSWSKANRKQMEDFADQYAHQRSSLRSVTYECAVDGGQRAGDPQLDTRKSRRSNVSPRVTVHRLSCLPYRGVSMPGPLPSIIWVK